MTRKIMATTVSVLLLVAINAAAQSSGSAMDYLNRGNAALAEGNWEKAVADFTFAIRINSRIEKPFDNSEQPDKEIFTSDVFNACAFSNRGIANYRLGNLEKAVADFDRAIRINPRLADAYNNRGNYWQAKGNLDKALHDFDQAIKFDPRHSHAFNNRANLRQSRGDLIGAIADYDHSIELDASNATVFANRGLTRLQLGCEEEANLDFNRALKLDPGLKKNLQELITKERNSNLAKK